jgi:hypothetical protein
MQEDAILRITTKGRAHVGWAIKFDMGIGDVWGEDNNDNMPGKNPGGR